MSIEIEKEQPQTKQTEQEREVRALGKDIAQTRSEMGATIQALEHRLSPAELGEKAKIEIDHIEARLKVAMKEGLDEAKSVLEVQIASAKGAVHEELLEAKALLGEQIVEAKGAVQEKLQEAKGIVTQGLSDARDSLKQDIQTAIVHTKESIREATIGRVENIATQAGDVMNQARDTLVDTVRRNPVPAALAGIGIAWLLMNRSSANRQRTQRFEGGWRGGTGGSDDYGYGNGSGLGHAVEGVRHAGGQVAHRASDAVHQVGSALGSAGNAVSGAAHDATEALRGALGQGVDAASHLAQQTSDVAGRVAHDAADRTGAFVHSAADTAGQLAHRAQDAVGTAAQTARDQAMRVERGLEATLQSNPLALGAVALAVGAAVGYSLPRTQKEDAWMGEVRDRLLHGATEMAQDAAKSLQHLTEDAGETAKKALTASASAK
jgi:hypothetical protein